MPLKALIARNPTIDWEKLDEVFFGCAKQAGEDNRNLARMALQIIGIVFCAVGMLLCVIWAAWLAGLMKQHYPPDAGVPGRTIDLETWKRQQQNPPK